MEPAPPISPPLTADEAFTLEYLESHDAACPACGYNVRALPRPRCPECGQALVLRIVATDRHSHAWVLALVAASVAAGIGVLVLALVCRPGWPEPFVPTRLRNHLGFFLALIPAPALALLVRRPFSRLAPRLRRLVAVVVAVFVTVVLWFFLSCFAR